MKPREHVLQDCLYSSLLLPGREPHQRFRHGVPLLLLAALRDLVVVVELVKGVEYLGRRLNLIIFHN